MVETDVLEPEPRTAIVSPSALEALTRSEVDLQIKTAKEYPRSIKAFKETALAMATLDEETAARCIYALPRKGKAIEGPSVRLAEIVVSAWGNLRVGTRIVEEGEKFVTAQSVAHDLERNVAISVEVRRRITDKRGRRYGDDMIGVTCNAAASIAMRNAVFKVIPMAYTKEIYASARQTAIGDAKTLASRRADMVGYFGKMGVQPEQILTLLEKKGVEDIDLEDMAKLQGLATAIKEGETTIDEAFHLAPDIKPPKRQKKSAPKEDLFGDGEVASDAQETVLAEVVAMATRLKSSDADPILQKHNITADLETIKAQAHKWELPDLNMVYTALKEVESNG